MKKIVSFFLFSSFILLLSIVAKPKLNFAFAYDASCDEAGENCCPGGGLGGQLQCAPTLECNSSTNKCVTKSCGNEGLQCCLGGVGSRVCNTPDLECNLGTNKCQSKSCGNEGLQCCLGGVGSRVCNTPVLKCDDGICIINTGSTGPTIPVYDPTCVFDSSEIPEGGRIRREGVKTALGCLSTNPEGFVNTAMPWAVGIGAGIAFLLGVFGAMMIVLSAGNPEKMQAGKEMITSAIGGLILIIFAVFILKIIGVDILKLF